ncbi:hypothetical protein TNCV_1917101 [Trichonephila clavipes]|uniref:Uncharacterized protein n=1 Tax=Trichonephila clavipes TaxID=2585209 RepID=A0A8X6W0S6_TRICX|nr:hypothetical protein TNCV_1917101 [Trichonephila clavipes]
MHKATVYTNSNLTIVMMQAEWDSSVNTISFHSAIHRAIGGGNACGFKSRVSKAMHALRTLHTAANGVKWYKWSPNNAQQIGFGLLWFMICG